MKIPLTSKNSCIIDIETRSRANLEVCGAIEYAKHESTSIFCVGYKIDDGLCKIWIPEKNPMPSDLWDCFQHATLKAHNASFERAIIQHCLPRYPLLTKEQKEYLK